MQTNTQSVHATPKQTWSTGSGIQKAKINFPLQFKKKKVDQSKKKLTNQIRAVSRPSYEYV